MAIHGPTGLCHAVSAHLRALPIARAEQDRALEWLAVSTKARFKVLYWVVPL